MFFDVSHPCQTAKQVERIVRHEAAAIQGIHQQLGERFRVRIVVVVVTAVDLDSGDQQLVQGVNVGNHATAGDGALGSELCRLRMLSGNDTVTLTDTSVGRNQAEVFASNC